MNAVDGRKLLVAVAFVATVAFGATRVDASGSDEAYCGNQECSVLNTPLDSCVGLGDSYCDAKYPGTYDKCCVII
ncbi:MAG: hypothetical protein AMXMBFR57_15940 [Acidimicrobiia bacterium]|jgi:hypothetical protein